MNDSNQKIIFIAEYKPDNLQSSSTHIMTNNLIEGLSKLFKKNIFISIGTTETKELHLQFREKLSDKTQNIYFVPSKINHVKSKFQRLVRLFKAILFRKKLYSKYINNIIIEDNTIIISHSPSIDSVLVGELLHRKNKTSRFIEYWSDPIALSGILPENLNYKRRPFMWIESKLLSFADEIVYGTNVLYDFQRRIYPDLSDKMRYVDVSYIDRQDGNVEKYGLNKILYAGCYYKSIRNIDPLVLTMKEMPSYQLDIYGNGDCSESSDNVFFHDAVSPQIMQEVECKYQTIICILNSNCIQIPGKIFYSMNKNCNILVIADGKYKNEIIDYLKTYKRFIVCDNTTESIKNALAWTKEHKMDNKYAIEHFSPKEIAKQLLEGKDFEKNSFN